MCACVCVEEREGGREGGKIRREGRGRKKRIEKEREGEEGDRLVCFGRHFMYCLPLCVCVCVWEE